MMDRFEFRARGMSGVEPEIEDLAAAVIQAAIAVHKTLKPGLPENIYRNALSIELQEHGIPHCCEAPVPVVYKGHKVGEGRVDILVDGKLVVELKAVEALNDVHKAQVLGYLQAMNLKLGLLINFNVLSLG